MALSNTERSLGNIPAEEKRCVGQRAFKDEARAKKVRKVDVSNITRRPPRRYVAMGEHSSAKSLQ
jgi:hypothetical protein